jgi:F-type H+-transporting ATPase subunit delta
MLPQVDNLIGLLLRRRRLEAIVDIAREFRRLYNMEQGIVEARATSAAKLNDEEVNALRARLEQMTGGRIELTLGVDPALLGGLQVRMGDLLIDGSVRGRLDRLRSRLESGALTA